LRGSGHEREILAFARTLACEGAKTDSRRAAFLG
jgi:hypothetical protein